MFGSIEGMLGSMGKGAIAKMLKPHLPNMLKVAVLGIIEAGGGDVKDCACLCWKGTRADGTDTVLASIFRLNELSEPGECLGTIDVLVELDTLNLEDFIDG